jgi:hypothetical protein
VANKPAGIHNRKSDSSALTTLARGAGKSLQWCLIFIVEILGCVIVVAVKVLLTLLLAGASKDVKIQGPTTPPQLWFGCGDQGTPALEALFAIPAVIPEIKDLHASLAVSISDFSSGRAAVVRQLNHADIPLAAGVGLPEQQGYYLNAGNAPAAVARFEEFEKWTAQYGLEWTSVGLDFEPNYQEFASLKGHEWHLAAHLLERSLESGRVRRARSAYSALIQRIQSAGYSVQTYQMPYIVEERKLRSTLPDRLLGTVDVHGNLDVVMLYTSSFRATDSAIIWKLGPGAQAIAVGSTEGSGGGTVDALNWDEFSHDLIVASHFTRIVGVYNLEGCVRRGFLPRLKEFNWRQSVTIPAKAARSVTLLGTAIETSLWTISHWAYFAAVILLADIMIMLRRRGRNRPSP